MTESTADIERSWQKLIFASGEPAFNSTGSFWFLIVAAVFVAAIYALAAASASATVLVLQYAGVFFAFLLAGFILFYFVGRQWIVEIDLTARRLRISLRLFGRWTMAIVDCPLDQCSALGTVEYYTDGHISYGTYVQTMHDGRHAIPLKDSTFEAATKVASQLSAATGIPRLDTEASAEKIHSLVMARAKDGTPMERCARIVYYIALGVGIACSMLPIPSVFFPHEYFAVTAVGFALVPALFAWAIWEWLKWRLL